MTVVAFVDPFWHHVQYRCRRCGVLVLVSLGNGATAPREGFYSCSDHREDVPAGLERVLSLVAPAQGELGEGA